MKKCILLAVALATGLGVVTPGSAQLITNYLPKTYNNSPEHINSQLYDNGINVGLNTMNPVEKLDIVGGNVQTTGSFISLAPTGTAPLCVSSNAFVPNLNADFLDGCHASYFAANNHTHAGMLTGNGQMMQVAFWSTSNQLVGSPFFFWDDAHARLGIQTDAPQARIHIKDPNNEAAIMIEGQHSGLHGSLIDTRWSFRNFGGKLCFDWMNQQTPVSIMKISGGVTSGIVEVNGNLKANRLYLSQDAVTNYLLACGPNGLAMWRDPQLIVGWQIVGSNVQKNNGIVMIGNENMGAMLNIKSEGIPALILQADPAPSAYGYGMIAKTNSNNFKALAIEKSGVEKLVIWGDGKMQVDNVIKANEVEVKINVWEDVVFDPSYPLMPLSEVESYILKNKHLPDVPCEDEVLKDGIRVGEMNALLLKKIEELTLYVIELEKSLCSLKAEKPLASPSDGH